MKTTSIFNIKNTTQFEKASLRVFQIQYEKNKVYREFCDHLKIKKDKIETINQIPFLPIQFFKSHKVLASTNDIQKIFSSSGTTASTLSKHYLTDLSLYIESFNRCFTGFYGKTSEYVILALLPSYFEQEGSSLVFMVNDLIKKSNSSDSGFYLNNYEELISKLIYLDERGEKVILFGVTYALLDIVKQHQFELKNTIIIETGGMKGRRKEMIRQELHEILCKGFGVKKIHSEYGMTELLSQCYSLEEGVFESPNWMEIKIRDTEDAFSYVKDGKTGGINIIDLANVYSCSFIATQDLGKKVGKNKFEVLGRFDHSDIRGCNLMIL